MAVEIKVPTIDGLTLNTKNKRVKDDIAITIGIPRYDGTVIGEFTNELEDFIAGTMKEYSNEKLTEVAAYGFCGRELEKLSLPNVTTIGAYTFYSMLKLQELHLPKLEKVTGVNAIGGCTSLEYIYLPKLKSAATQQFSGCKNLKVAVFDSIDTIAGFAFQGCTGLEKLVIRQSEKICTLGNAFYGFTYSGAIYVPDELVEDYKAHTNWAAYAEQIKPLSEYVEV